VFTLPTPPWDALGREGGRLSAFRNSEGLERFSCDYISNDSTVVADVVITREMTGPIWDCLCAFVTWQISAVHYTSVTEQ